MPENVNNNKTREFDIKNEVERQNKTNKTNDENVNRSGENKAENTTTDYKR